MYGKDWEKKLQDITESIVFIDESGRFTKSTDFASVIQNTNHYYVIVSREKLSVLPYSIQEIYGIRENGKYMGLKTQYTLNEFYNIYGQLIIQMTELQYNKSKLNPYYLSERNLQKIGEQLPNNIFDI